MSNVLVPHDPTRGPLTAIRRVIVHSSVGELKERGLFPTYSKLAGDALVREITDSIGPGWLPIELALAHYRACDDLNLSDATLHQLGERSCEKVKGTLFPVEAQAVRGAAEQDVWAGAAALARMGRRIYEGGSAQYTRVGPSELAIEHVNNSLFSVRYYRVAHVGFLTAAFRDFGVKDVQVKLTTHTRKDVLTKVAIRWA